MADRPQSAEMTPGPGFRIRNSYPNIDKALVDKFRTYETPDISDMLNRMYSMSCDLQNLVNDKPLVGVACTVKVYPGDNLMVHKALDVARPGDVIVVDAGGHTTNAVFGDLVAQKAAHRGIAGFIIDGLIRDIPGLIEIGLPIYSIGSSPKGPLHRGPGEINFPISCGGIVVNPGDLVAADSNGIVVVRNEFAEDTANKLHERQASLENYIAEVKRGNFSNAWVDRLLDSCGCEVDE